MLTNIPTELHPYLPATTHLYYVPADLHLGHRTELLYDCIRHNSLCPVTDFIDSRYDPDTYNYFTDLLASLPTHLQPLAKAHRTELYDYFSDTDTSDPARDLIRHTPPINCFYTLGGVTAQTTATDLARLLQLTTTDLDDLQLLLDESHHSGELRIYFAAPLTSLLSPQPLASPPVDWRQIGFVGTYIVAIYNSLDGSGYFTHLRLQTTLPFSRSRLAPSDTDRHSIEHCCGLADYWLSDTQPPQFSFNPADTQTSLFDTPVALADPATHQHIERERTYTLTYAQGGCTAGDTNINRHRHITYLTSYPHGHRCTRCGQFWAD